MRRSWLALTMVLFFAPPAQAKEPPCPLELGVCLARFQRMHERPWFGASFDTDSAGVYHVVSVVHGAPAERAGVRAGDVLESIEGRPPLEWFASKAGWKNGESGDLAVLRKGREHRLPMAYERIPEDEFARIVGVHMVEGHLAYMNHPHERGSAREPEQH